MEAGKGRIRETREEVTAVLLTQVLRPGWRQSKGMGNGHTEPVVEVELTGLAVGWELGVRGREKKKMRSSKYSRAEQWKGWSSHPLSLCFSISGTQW